MKDSELLRIVLKTARQTSASLSAEGRQLSAEVVLLSLLQYADMWLDKDRRKDPVVNSENVKRELGELAEAIARMGIATDKESRTAFYHKLKAPDANAEARFDRLRAKAEEKPAGAQEGELTTLALLEELIRLPEPCVQELLGPAPDAEKLESLYELIRRREELTDTLRQKIIGQNEAVEAFVDGIISASLFPRAQEDIRPKGIFLFAGPPGVGKTYLAEEGAKALGLPVKRFDMSEYVDDEDSTIHLLGLDRSWKHGHAGELTSWMSERNREGSDCVIIFDEVEKASPAVIHLFLQLLDAGRLTDKYLSDTVPFRNAYLIFTTNAGRSLYEEGKQPPRHLAKSLIIDAIGKDCDPRTQRPLFPGAILSRFESGTVLMFRHLGADELTAIGMTEMKKVAAGFETMYGPKVVIDEMVPFLLLMRQGGETDARSFRSNCGRFLRENLLGLTAAVPIRNLSDALWRKNSVSVSVDSRHRAKLETLLWPQIEQGSVMLICRDKQTLLNLKYALEDVGDGFGILSRTDYGAAWKDIDSGRCSPSAIVADIGDRDDGGYSHSEAFAENAPLSASRFDELRRFLVRLVSSGSDIPFYVAANLEGGLPTGLEKHLTELGTSEVFLYDGAEQLSDRDGVAEKIYDRVCKDIETARLRAAARRLAREHKSLSFTAAPGRLEQGVALNLRDFSLDTLISGSDSDGVASGDRMPSVSFDDYVGGESIKAEMREFIQFLQSPAQYEQGGGTAPRGVLLYGPPGTGKTFFAKAVAHEALVPFFYSNGSNFVGRYVGSGPEAVKKLFSTARKYAPSIVFIDEIDAIARNRTGSEQRTAQEETLNMLLSEMDGFENDHKRPVFVIGATNYGIDPGSGLSIDPALVRRFTRTVFVDLPGLDDRRSFCRRSLKDCPLSEGELDSLARRSVGMNYGELGNVFEKARRDARKQGVAMNAELVSEALETVRFGEKKSWGPGTLERVAWHEAGHAYMSIVCGETPEYITITARGSMGGYVMRADREDKPILTKRELLDSVRISLAGRAAEILRYGQEDGLSTGASDDLAKAWRLTTDYVARYSMDEEAGIVYAPDEASVPREVADRVKKILEALSDEVLERLRGDSGSVRLLAETLLATNSMTGAEAERRMAEVK